MSPSPSRLEAGRTLGATEKALLEIRVGQRSAPWDAS